MKALREHGWSLAFSAAIAVLMATVLFSRSPDVPVWVLIVYPGFGAVLAHAASRTSPNPEQLTWIEAGTIAAAGVIVLAVLVNLLVPETALGTVLTAGGESGSTTQLHMVPLGISAVLLWRALQQRLEGLRRALLERRTGGQPQSRVIPAE